MINSRNLSAKAEQAQCVLTAGRRAAFSAVVSAIIVNRIAV
jgi:hypothetical protein